MKNENLPDGAKSLPSRIFEDSEGNIHVGEPNNYTQISVEKEYTNGISNNNGVVGLKHPQELLDIYGYDPYSFALGGKDSNGRIYALVGGWVSHNRGGIGFINPSADINFFKPTLDNHTGSKLALENGAIYLISTNETSGNTSGINIDTTFITIHSNVTTFKGLEYNEDFSTNFTDRSLVDKGYVDNSLLSKVNTNDLSTVATSGDYNDLINTPPFVSDSVIKETINIALSPFNEDLTDDVIRNGFIVTYPFEIIDFQTTAYPVPTGSNLITELRKNGVSVTTTHSVIPNGENNSTTSASPVFTSNTFVVGDRIDFYTPINGVGSIESGQNLIAVLTIKRTEE